MRPVSQGVRRAVEELHAAVREGARGGPAARLRGLVEGIGTSREWMVIPHLVSLALDRSDEELADCAADAVLGLFDRVPLRGVHPLDRALREQSVWKLAAWYEVQPGELARISRRAHAPMLVQLLMCHPDGRVREAAIRMANLRPDRGRELRFLLVRLNDWVPEVRRAASEALRARLTASSADDLWAALPLLDDAPRWGRIEERAILDEIDAFLLEPRAADSLLRALVHPDRRVRRGAFRRGLGSRHVPRQDIMTAALLDPDPTIRVWASGVLDPERESGLEDLLALMLGGPLGSIRHRALELALERGIAAELEPLLTDSHAGVRSLAQAALLSRDVDVVAIYRSTLDSTHGRRRAAAVMGLAETAGDEATEELTPPLRDGAPAVRRAALHALDDLRPEDSPARCLAALADPSPRVTHAARDLLLRGRSIRDPAVLWRALGAAPALHGQLDALAVLGRLDHWRRLPYLLDATALGPELRARSAAELARWIALSASRFTAPSPETAASIRRALARAAIDDGVRREIGRILAAREALR